MNNKMISIIMVGITSTSMLVGCNKEEKQEISGDDIFLECFEESLDKRWDEAVKIEDNFKEGKYSEDEYYERVIESIQEEVDSLEENKYNIEDKELKTIVDNYIQGDKLQIECFKTDDVNLTSKYYEESNNLRKPALISLVEDYGVEIDEEHQQTYKDFKEEATVINKENDAKDFANKLANEMVFETNKDEYGNTEFVAIVENTSEIDFASLQFQVNYKDADGVTVGSDWIFIENFDKGSKQKVTLYPYENVEDIEKIVVTTDYVETK